MVSIFLVLFVILPHSSSYTYQEILFDRDIIPWSSLRQYRGNILDDIWMNDNNEPPQVKNIHTCQKLFHKSLENITIEWPPPEVPPEGTLDDYTLGGRSLIQYLWADQKRNGGEGYSWSNELFDVIRSRRVIGCGLYIEHYCDDLVRKHQQYIENKVAVVVGSETPWAEASLLNAGASHVITIEYMKITSAYPNHSSMLPSEVATKYLEKSWSHVDFAYSYSSIEHDGLGRYGDALNPVGDLESLARIRCLLKPGGVLFLAVPVAPDTIVWNLHRVYGRYRLGLLLLGWKILDIFPENCDVVDATLHGSYYCQPIIVLQKPHPTLPLLNHKRERKLVFLD